MSAARGGLITGVIVGAAFRVLERSGLSGVTARAVAAELGVRPSALYHHLPDMATLLDEMATAMRREMNAQPSPRWDATLRETGRTVRRSCSPIATADDCSPDDGCATRPCYPPWRNHCAR